MLPPVLGASMHAMAYILSLDGLSGISVPIEAVDRLTSMVNATEIDMSAQERRKGMVQNSNGFPRSHMSHGTHQQSPSRHRHTRLPAPMGTTSLGNPSSQKVRPPLNSAGMNQYQRPALRGPGPGVDGNSLGMLGQHGPRGDSLKRQRGNGSR
jgi:ATP-dependent RNA helicase DHX36